MSGISKKKAEEMAKKCAYECEYTYINIKAYLENLYRYYHGNVDIVADKLASIKALSNTLIEQKNVLTDSKKAEIIAQKKALLDEKDNILKQACAEEGLVEQLFDRIKDIDNEFYFVAGIIHDKDVFVEDFWTIAPETDHIHIVFAGTLSPSGQRRRVKVAEALDMLGLAYDKDADMNALSGGAIQVCRDLIISVKYLTHETPASITDGKYQYDREEVVTNNRSEYDTFMGFIKGTSEKCRLTAEQAVAYAPEFTKYGSQLLSFRDAFKKSGFSDWMWRWLDAKPSIRKVLESAYLEGIQSVIGTDVERVCIYIYGTSEIGKTTAVERLCTVLGLDRSQIFSCVEGTGKYDDLTAQHEVLLADDVSLESVLKIADERVCQLNQRCKGKSVWAGHFVIATSNIEPEEMFHKWKTDKSGNILVDRFGKPRVHEKWEGRTSRFAFVKADENGDLTITKPYERGTRTDKAMERNKIIRAMVKAMQESTREYCRNARLTEDELNTYPTRDLALLARTDIDFKRYWAYLLETFDKDMDIVYDIYLDECNGTPELLGIDDIEFIRFADGSVL